MDALQDLGYSPAGDNSTNNPSIPLQSPINTQAQPAGVPQQMMPPQMAYGGQMYGYGGKKSCGCKGPCMGCGGKMKMEEGGFMGAEDFGMSPLQQGISYLPAAARLAMAAQKPEEVDKSQYHVNANIQAPDVSGMYQGMIDRERAKSNTAINALTQSGMNAGLSKKIGHMFNTGKESDILRKQAAHQAQLDFAATNQNIQNDRLNKNMSYRLDQDKAAAEAARRNMALTGVDTGINAMRDNYQSSMNEKAMERMYGFGNQGGQGDTKTTSTDDSTGGADGTVRNTPTNTAGTATDLLFNQPEGGNMLRSYMQPDYSVGNNPSNYSSGVSPNAGTVTPLDQRGMGNRSPLDVGQPIGGMNLPPIDYSAPQTTLQTMPQTTPDAPPVEHPFLSAEAQRGIGSTYVDPSTISMWTAAAQAANQNAYGGKLEPIDYMELYKNYKNKR
jgi:hypothetical protein